MSRSVVWVLLASACTISEEKAPEALASAWCDRARECDRGDFDASWDSRAECEDDITDTYESVQDVFDLLDCEYSGREAARARSDIRSASCEDFVQGDFDLTDVYECGS